jgi:hypothetical protein
MLRINDQQPVSVVTVTKREGHNALLVCGYKHIPKIVTLCGSTRFKEEFEKAEADLTDQGCIVLSVGRFGHRDGLDMDGDLKKRLDELHLRKIDLADEVFVINATRLTCCACKKPCEDASRSFHFSPFSDCCKAECNQKPYVGESTRREIEYALSVGTPVRYLNSVE